MNIFLIGQGNVGTALSRFLQGSGIRCEILENVPSGRDGLLFLAVPESAVKPLVCEALEKNPGIYAVHFSAAVSVGDERVFLLHPYSSINKESDLGKIVFTLWGRKDPAFEEMLKETGLRFSFCGRSPDILYHASAVMSGNFTQFFVLQSLKILEDSGFSKEISEQLVRQLLNSSIDNLFRKGARGVTGPAVRGEKEVLLNEINALKERDEELSRLFEAVNEALSKLVSGLLKNDKT